IPESLPASRRHSGGFRTFLRNVRALLHRRIFVSYMLVNAFSAFALMAYVSASSFVVQEMLGFTSSEYSISFAINSMGMMAMSLLSARLTRTIHPRRLIRVGLIVVSLASFALLIGSLFRSEEHTSELQSRFDLVCRLLLEKKKKEDYSYTRC